MPNGQGGEEWVDEGAVGNQIRRIREAARERTEHLQRSFYTIQPGETVHIEQGTYMAGRSFTVAENALYWGAMSNDLWYSSPPKPKRPKRPISAIFYPMVNECGY